MRTEHLTYFLSLAETHSITQSSRDLYTTHQNVSKIIRQLEEDLGTVLFIRSQKGVELTATGKLLLPLAQRTVNDFAQLRADMVALEKRTDITGELHVLGSEIVNFTIFDSLIHIFAELYPSLSIRLEGGDPIDVLRAIALHPQKIGVVVVLSNPEFYNLYTPYIEQVRLTALAEDRYCCVGSATSALKELKSISLAQFVQYPFATIDSGDNGSSIVTRLVTERGGSVAFSTNNRQSFVKAIQSGRYISISSERAHQKQVEDDLRKEQLKIIPFQEDLRLNICLAVHRHPQLSEAGETFVQFVKRSHLYV